MSEIKALGKLRAAARNMAKGRNLENHEECNLLLVIAGEIEAEIAERFVELPQGWTGEQASDILAYWPTWDDGSPCMFGDEFTCYPKYDCEKKYETLDRLSIFGPNHVWDRGRDDERPHDGGYYEWNYMRPGGDGCEEYRPTKRKPRTLEDVLNDCADEISEKRGIAPELNRETPTRNEIVDKYAAEIRELLGVGE